MPRLAIAVIGFAVIAVLGLAAAIAFGGPAALPPHGAGNPLAAVDFSDLPAPRHFAARDGASLAYRAYGAERADAEGSVVLVHGSSARSEVMHPMAKGFVAGGYTVYALDVRGHGESGTKGQIAYIGQLEDDFEDFMKSVKPSGPSSLVGFSAGGGFVLRFAADARQRLFDNYLLLAPFLSQSAATYRPSAGGWASVGMPRIVALTLLDSIGVTAFNELPVIAFALRPDARLEFTPYYAFALGRNFGPHLQYRDDIAAARQPMEVLVGERDEQFVPEQFAPEFSAAGRDVPVAIVPNVSSHIDLLLAPSAIRAAVSAIDRLDARHEAFSSHE